MPKHNKLHLLNICQKQICLPNCIYASCTLHFCWVYMGDFHACMCHIWSYWYNYRTVHILQKLYFMLLPYITEYGCHVADIAHSVLNLSWHKYPQNGGNMCQNTTNSIHISLNMTAMLQIKFILSSTKAGINIQKWW